MYIYNTVIHNFIFYYIILGYNSSYMFRPNCKLWNKSYIGKLHLTIDHLLNRCCSQQSECFHPQAYTVPYKRNFAFTLLTNFVNLKYNIYFTGTYNYKLLLIECHHFYNKLILTILKTQVLQEKLHHHILVRNHTEDTASGKTSPPYFNKKEFLPLYIPITTPSILLNLFFNALMLLMLPHMNFNLKFFI